MKKSKKNKKLQTLPLSRFLAETFVSGRADDDCRQRQRVSLKCTALEKKKASAKSMASVATTLVEAIELPTAPRAHRLLDNDTSIPHRPPFVAFINNLPFDAHEAEVRAMFDNLHIQSLRLPREDRFSKRTRGFAYLEFKTREELITLLCMEEPTLRGRRLRIEVSNDHDGYYVRKADDGGQTGDDWRTPAALNYGQQQFEWQHDVGDNGGSNVKNLIVNESNAAEGNCYIGGSCSDFDKEFPILSSRLTQRETTSPTTATPDHSQISSSSSSVEHIFGFKKPVDTVLNEREIDTRLDHEHFAHQRLEQLANFENSMSPNRQYIFGGIRPPKLHFFRNI